MFQVKPRLRALARSALLVAAIAGGGAVIATPAQAWWHGGVFIGVPSVVVAPAYYPPYAYAPGYYPPAYYPPYAYAPYGYPPGSGQAPQAQPQAQTQQTPAPQGQARQQIAYGSMCYAGVYQCAAPNYSPIGQGCTCPGLGAPSYGSVR